MFLNYFKKMETVVLIHLDIVLVVGFQRNEKPVLIGIVAHRVHQLGGNAFAAHRGPHRKVDNMHSPVGVQVVGPLGVEVSLPLDEVPKGFKRMVFTNQVKIGLERVKQLNGIVLERVVGLAFVRNNDNSVEIGAVGVDFAVFKEFIKIAAKKFRQKFLTFFCLRDQVEVERIFCEGFGQQRIELLDILFLYTV